MAARVIIEGFVDVEEAKKWCIGYEGGAEQTMAIWSDENGQFPWRTMMQAFPGAKKYFKVDGDDVHIRLAPYDK